ncbi:MAG: M15 family metallopeptidase [Verrucomicrobiota bacterium]
MTTDEIKAIQTEIGAEPDRIWGEESKACCKAFLRSLCSDNPWPHQSQAAEFYGPHGTNLTRIDVTGLGVRYEGNEVLSVLCHAKVADDLLAILTEISQSPWADVLSRYAGCYNDRSMIGGNMPSMHTYGVAVDIDPDTNGMHDIWPVRATMPWGVLKIWATHGWYSLGPMAGFDAMHTQATRDCN